MYKVRFQYPNAYNHPLKIGHNRDFVNYDYQTSFDLSSDC